MSSSAPWPKIESLFHQAVELDPEQRRRFLAEHCQGDEDLRRQLEELLFADGDLSATWSGLARSGLAGSDQAQAMEFEESIAIPGYEDLELLGRGGMGTVYLAHRHDQLFEGKAFAIKVLHAHRTSVRGKRRFDTERRLLAGLDHPNIVRLYDGGELADGRPYLVMDHVDGRPLDVYCRNERLTIAERLRLFQKICAALHYAHQNLVVHRDLKPSNILVDTDGIPHLLDFGIAKRLSNLDAPNPATTGWMVPMTPAYASPEQIAGEPVTTASDLYSLGLVLFELLTDRLPDPPRRHQAEQPDPPRPSSKVTDVTQATDRRTTIPRLRRRLQGDLDQILGKTLRIEPEARYASARELAEDVERHLNDLPVLARHGSWRYLAGRFLQRHRFGVILTCSAMLVLALAVTAGIQSKRLVAAEASGAEKERLVRRLAGPEDDFLMDEGGLDRVVTEIVKLDLPDESKSLFLDTVRRLHLPEGQLFDQLQELLLEQEEMGVNDPNLAKVAFLLGELLFHGGYFAEAEEVLASSARLAEAGHGADSVELAPYLENHARVLAELERYPEGVAALRRSILLRRAGESETDLAEPLSNLAQLLYLRGAFAESVATCRKALAILDRHDGGNPSLRATLLTSLSVALVDLRSDDLMEEAETYAREALALQIEVHGPRHMLTLATRHNLTMVLARSGQLEQALTLSVENLELAEQIMGRDHPRLGYLLTNIATTSSQLGRPEVCVDYARQAVALREEKLPPGNFLTAVSKTRLANCLADLGQNTEAIALLRSGIDELKKSKVEDSHWLAGAQSKLDELTSERESP